MSDIVFHLPTSWLGPFGTGLLPFYQRVLEGLRARGFEVSVTPLDRDHLDETLEADVALHIVNHGRIRHPRAWNAGIAYIYPFWNMDPHGIRAFSSIGAAKFRPSDIDPELARPFFRKVRQRIVTARTSRYEQPSAQEQLPTAKAAVFLQSEAHRVVGETCHLTRWDMVSGVCDATDGIVLVKPHPRDTDPETLDRLEHYKHEYPHLHVFQGNIHDAIAAADRVVTINSAVGIEAYLHRKPVVLCGQSDFHHIASLATSPLQLKRIMETGPRKRAYDKFIWWYFGHHCLSTTEPDLTDRFLKRVGLD